MSDTLETLRLESDRSRELSTKEMKPEGINMENNKSSQKGCANVLVSQDEISLDTFSSSQFSQTVETLYDQIQSLHHTVDVLEQRFTVLEEMLSKLTS